MTVGYDSCQPCCSPEQTGRSEDLARVALIRILCDIKTALELDLTEAEFSYGSKSFDELEADYQVLLMVSSPLRGLHIHNSLDGDVMFRVGTSEFKLLAGTSPAFDLSEKGLKVSSNIEVKQIIGEIYSMGSIVCIGY